MAGERTVYAQGQNGELYLDLALAIAIIERSCIENQDAVLEFLRSCLAIAQEHAQPRSEPMDGRDALVSERWETTTGPVTDEQLRDAMNAVLRQSPVEPRREIHHPTCVVFETQGRDCNCGARP